MDYGLLYYVSLVGIGGATIAWALVWSRKVKERKARGKFKLDLQGYRFTSWDELRDHWRAKGLFFNLDGGFDPNRHGNLLETLRVIDEQAQAVYRGK